jgi:hypothetical protein
MTGELAAVIGFLYQLNEIFYLLRRRAMSTLRVLENNRRVGNG